MRLLTNILRKINKASNPEFFLRINEGKKFINNVVEKKQLSLELHDEISYMENGMMSIKITKRHIDNGDIFLYIEIKNVKKCNLKVEVPKNTSEIVQFEEYYQKPGYDNRYGENKVTGPFRYMECKEGSVMISKIYYFNRLRKQYTENEYSEIYELIEESDNIEIEQANVIYNIDNKAQECSFFLLLSNEKLFNSRKSLNEYIQDYYLNIKTNYVVSSYFIQPSGTYTKLPYSIEPFTKNGYGYSLHHSSKKELIPFLEQLNDRYFYDMIVNAVLQTKMYQKQDTGVYYTPFTSTWLKKDTGITAPYIDTRLNETYNLMLEDLYKITNNDLFKDGINDYLNYLVKQKNIYLSENGMVFPDYFKDGLKEKTHASLNHQLGIANLAYKQYKKECNEDYKELFVGIYNFIKDTTQSWIKENGDLYYGITLKDNDWNFYGNDYIYVTLIDLLRLQINIIDFWGRKSDEVTKLVNSKIQYLQQVGYSIFEEDSMLPPGESIKTRKEAKNLYLSLYPKYIEKKKNCLMDKVIPTVLGENDLIIVSLGTDFENVISLMQYSNTRKIYLFESPNLICYELSTIVKNVFNGVVEFVPFNIYYYSSDGKEMDDDKDNIVEIEDPNILMIQVDNLEVCTTFLNTKRLFKKVELIFVYGINETAFASINPILNELGYNLKLWSEEILVYGKGQRTSEEMEREALKIVEDYLRVVNINTSVCSKIKMLQKKNENYEKNLEELKQEMVVKTNTLETDIKNLESLYQDEKNHNEKATREIMELSEKLKNCMISSEDYKKSSMKYCSAYQYEQKKCESLKNELEQYKSSKAYKLQHKLWRIKSDTRFYTKKHIYKLAYKIYRIIEPYPPLVRLAYKVNDKLQIVKDKDEARQIYQASKNQVTWQHNTLKTKKIKELKIAAILDEFSYNCFKYECNLLVIEPDNWLDIFESEQPDIFLCESAWSGADNERRPWKGKIYSSVNFSKENRTVLLSILSYCQEHGIPTVFWNKEDPSHYDDKIHNFVDTAVKFDHIFTTAEECVERYKEEYGQKSVHTLMFATQPKLFNPIEKYNRTDEVIFAGSWYVYHEERCREMEEIFDKILDSGKKLVIYNRYYGDSDPNHVFPKKYEPYIRPALPFEEIDKAYKGSEIALNITTVTESETMFARRVFELASCNTAIISNYSAGIEKVFGDNIIFTDRELDFSNLEEKKAANLENVLTYHTYSNRLEQMLNDIGYEYLLEDRSVSIYYCIENKDGLEKAIKNFQNITYIDKYLKIIYNDQNLDVNLIRNLETSKVEFYCSSYLKKYNKKTNDASAYVVYANNDLHANFIDRVICHYSYLEDDKYCVQNDFGFKIVDDVTPNTVNWIKKQH